MTCMNVSRNVFGKGAMRPLRFPNREQNIQGVISPRIGKHHGVPRPLEPGESGFCEAMDEVVEVRASVIRGDWPTMFLNKHFLWADKMSQPFDGSMIPEPLVRAGVVDGESAAALVRMDWPIDLAVFSYQYLRSEGVPLRHLDEMDFVNNVVGFTAAFSSHLYCAMENAFEVKYYYGAVRPEEYFGIDGCVFTAYTEGCPQHPAYPAGHATAGGASLGYLEWFFDFRDHAYARDQIIAAAYHFAQYRTFAGVHTAQDNIEGLKLGYRQDIKPVKA